MYDLLNIVPYIQKHGVDPVTGKPLKMGDLVRLNFTKNAAGEYMCPVLNKVFTEHSHIVAIRGTGNVFSHEAVQELNVKPKAWRDLLTDEPFQRADILTLQDPARAKNLESFHHVRAGHEGRPQAREGDVKVTSADVQRVLATVGKEQKEATSHLLARTKGAAEVEVKFRPGTQTWDSSDYSGVKAQKGPVDEKAAAIQRMHAARAEMVETKETTGLGSGSFTSTAVNVHTKNAKKLVRKEYNPTKKGYVGLHTNLGDLNLELHCDIAPRTCENFLTLCKHGYYDGVGFHRSIKNFMLQGGDPTGTGRGGESIYGKKFADELDSRLLHDGRGVLSMANSGKNTNGSQFFILYKSAKHLNFKHSVFGKLVGGLDVLAKMEAVETDAGDRPKSEIQILRASVYVDPFEEMREEAASAKAEEAKAVARKAEEPSAWFSNPGQRNGVGSGLAIGALAQQTAKKRERASGGAAPAAAGGGGGKKKKKKGGQGGFGNFDAW